MKKLHAILPILMLALLIQGPHVLQAQDLRAAASLDSNRILIGEQVHLYLSLTAPSGTHVQWPVFGDTLTAQIEVLAKSGIDTLEKASQRIYNQVLTLTCFDSGTFVVPSIPFVFGAKGDTGIQGVYTPALQLYVNTVQVDTTQAIKEIKEPMTAPITWREILPWALGGLGVLLLMAAIIYIIVRKRKNKPIFGPVRPPVPAHIKALQSLEQLRTARWWQQGMVKEYHSALSDIVRTYLDDRWSVTAIEMTTPEALDAMQRKGVCSAEQLRLLSVILQLADMVKFAKYQPLPDEHDRSMRDAVSLVTETAEMTTVAEEETRSDEENKMSDLMKGGEKP